MPTRSLSPKDHPALRTGPSQPVAEQDRPRLPRTGKAFARTAFVYDPSAGLYYCPMGHGLRPYKRSTDEKGGVTTYYQCQNCPQCPLSEDCLKAKAAQYRTITRDPYEPLREAAAERLNTGAGRAIYKRRAPGIESVFGLLKRAFGIRRFRTRGLANVRIEWIWSCTGYNLKKLLKLLMNTDRRHATPTDTPPLKPVSSPILAFWPLQWASRLINTCKEKSRGATAPGYPRLAVI